MLRKMYEGPASLAVEALIPEKRYLSREEAATWLGLSVDTFAGLKIAYCDFGPRCHRWDVLDIIAFAVKTKQRDSARTSKIKRRRQECDSINVMAHQPSGLIGETKTAKDTAKALGLRIKS